MQQRQPDPDRDTLFDRQHDDCGCGRNDQQEFTERLPVDGDDLTEGPDDDGDAD